jgi:hypothetical protein
MYFCVVLCIVCFVSFSVLFVCICVLYYCHRVNTQLLSLTLVLQSLVNLGATYKTKTRSETGKKKRTNLLKLCYCATGVRDILSVQVLSLNLL